MWLKLFIRYRSTSKFEDVTEFYLALDHLLSRDLINYKRNQVELMAQHIQSHNVSQNFFIHEVLIAHPIHSHNVSQHFVIHEVLYMVKKLSSCFVPHTSEIKFVRATSSP